MSGMLVPFLKLHNRYFFSDKNEPESWDENFNNLYKNYFKGENLPINELNYFYSLEKKVRKKIKNLDSIERFISDDPYIGTKKEVLNPTKIKYKKIKLHHEGLRGIPSEPFIELKKKYKPRKKRGKKKKNKDGLKHIKIKRIK